MTVVVLKIGELQPGRVIEQSHVSIVGPFKTMWSVSKNLIE
jgi:hypothetical protein